MCVFIIIVRNSSNVTARNQRDVNHTARDRVDDSVVGINWRGRQVATAAAAAGRTLCVCNACSRRVS